MNFKRKIKRRLRCQEMRLQSELFIHIWIKIKAVDENPAEGLETPKVEEKIPAILSTNEVEMLLEQPDLSETKGIEETRLCWRLWHATGIRVSGIDFT